MDVQALCRPSGHARIVTVRTALILLLATSTWAACGDDERAARSSASPSRTPEGLRAVQGYLDLLREQAGPPDAGTQTGHRGGGAKATTTGARFEFTGTAQPSEARVTVEGADARIDHRRDGVFIVTVRGLRRGTTELTVRASAPGLEPWSEAVTITRR
jgi:hypothetical protein